MSSFIANLRTKPDNIKRSIAFFSALGITIVIVIIWILVNSAGNSGGSEVAGDEKQLNAGQTITQSGTLSDLVTQIREKIDL